MNKKKVYLYLILAIFLISAISQTSAFFYKSHEYFPLKAFSEVDSPMTNLCRPYLKAFVDGDLSADVPVLHYFDNKVQSYIGTHSSGAGLTACLNEADTDEERCFCYGMGMHWIAHDRFSHTNYNGIPGLVPKYLGKYFGLNFIGHMTIERSFENQHIDYLQSINDPIVTSGELDYYDSTALDSLFSEFGGNDNLLKILSDQAGIDMTNDARIFRSGYHGEGFYNTVYKDKAGLPWWFWSICVILIILGILLIFMALKFGKNRWKWLILIEGIILLGLGLIILFSIFTGTTWKVTTIFIEIPPKFGYLKVSHADIIYYNDLAVQASVDYLKTGLAPLDDASGLSYVDRTGVSHKGDLITAQQGALYFVYPTLVILILLSTLALMYRAFQKKHSPSIFGKVGTWFISVFIILMAILLIYIVGALFFG